MRILLLSDWYHPAVNGVVVSVENLRRGLEELGHEVRIMTLSQDRRSYYENGIYRIGSHDAGMIYPGARLRSPSAMTFMDELRFWSPDILHTNCEFSTFFIALHLKKSLGIPLVHTYHTMYEDYTQYFFPSRKVGAAAVRFYTKFVAEKIDRIIAPTEKVRVLLEDYGVPCPVSVVPTGIDISRYMKPLTEKERGETRRRYGIPESDTLFIFCGRLAAEKNIETVIKAFGRKKDDVSLMIAGDGPMRHTLEMLSEEIGTGAVFTGMLSTEEAAACYKAADAFVSASRSETQGLTYIEALSSSLPLICFDDPVLEGVVRDGVNGILCSDAEEMEKAISVLAGDSSMRKRMAEESGKAAPAFGIGSFASAVLSVYKGLTGEAPASSDGAS